MKDLSSRRLRPITLIEFMNAIHTLYQHPDDSRVVAVTCVDGKSWLIASHAHLDSIGICLEIDTEKEIKENSR